MAELLKHLDREWAAMGWPTEGDDDPQVWVYENLKELIGAFSEQGHSGSSASYVISLFHKLAMWKPISPLTGDESEWTEVGEQDGKPLFQNKRCSHVFRCGDEAYDIRGRVFEEPDGCQFISRDSRVPVTFPYEPKTEIVKVDVQ